MPGHGLIEPAPVWWTSQHSAKSLGENGAFTDEFKAEAVGVVRSSGKSIGRIAQELDLTDTALRDWVRQAERRPAAPPVGETSGAS